MWFKKTKGQQKISNYSKRFCWR